MSFKLPLTQIALAAIIAMLPVSVTRAADPVEVKAGEARVPVDFFQAVKAGQIDAKLILKDAKQGNLLIKNNGKQPLQIRMPDGFAGKPVLAQFMPGGGLGVGGVGGLGAGGANQGVGAGLGGAGLGGGLFNVAPEQLKKFPVDAVCLEHGKKDPNPRVAYAVIPIEQFTEDTRVHELVRLLNTGKLNQRAAQVAAWNLASGMSFDELAAKKLTYANGTKQPYFSQAELMAGVEIATAATVRAKAHPQTEPSVSSAEK